MELILHKTVSLYLSKAHYVSYLHLQVKSRSFRAEAEAGLASLARNHCHCSSDCGFLIIESSHQWHTASVCCCSLTQSNIKHCVALMKTHFQRIDFFSLTYSLFLCHGKCQSIENKMKPRMKPSMCCCLNNCVGNAEMELNDARFAARGLGKKWLLCCLQLRECILMHIFTFSLSENQSPSLRVCKYHLTPLYTLQCVVLIPLFLLGTSCRF